MSTSLYDTLGVKKDASQDEIQKAYRKKARKLHPDVNKAPEAELKFKEIGEAYEVLKDPDKRKRYDQFGSDWKRAQQTGAPPPGWEGVHFGGQGFEGFDFGGMGGMGARRRFRLHAARATTPSTSSRSSSSAGRAASVSPWRRSRRTSR